MCVIILSPIVFKLNTKWCDFLAPGDKRGGFPENALNECSFGRRIFFKHHQCWEVLPFCRFQRQRCIKILCPKDPDFYTPLALKTAKGQHLPALVVYKNPSPIFLSSDLSVSLKIPENPPPNWFLLFSSWGVCCPKCIAIKPWRT